MFNNRPYINIIYVAYFNDKAIAMDERRNLFFQDIPEEFVDFGEVANFEDLTPIAELPDEERERIEKYCEDCCFPD